MKTSVSVLVCATLTACATPPQDRTPQRLGSADLARVQPPAVPTLTLEELAALATKGEQADSLITRIKAANAQYDLTPTQAMELHRKGLPLAVLDYLHESWNNKRQTERATELNSRDAACAQTLAQQRLEMKSETANCSWPPGYYNPWWPHRTWGGYYWRR